MAGKGSAPRPKEVEDETFSDNWERTFGKPEPEQEVETDDGM